MQVSVETTSGVERCLTIRIPKESIQPEIQKRLNSLARESKINGFRQGKIPMRVIEQRYGLKVREELFHELVETSLAKAVAQEQIRPVGESLFKLMSDIKTLENGLSYKATFEVYPTITTVHLDKLTVEKPVVNITEKDVDALLERLREQRKTWHEVDHSAITGDRLIIDFIGTNNGKSFKNNTFKKIPIILGQNDFILQGFEEKLLGRKKGENCEFDLTFPKEHSNLEIAGHTIHFVVQISKIEESQLPEINENFIKSFGVANGLVETLRVEARHNMERELNYVTTRTVKQQILDSLLKENPLDEIPMSLVKEETERLVKNQSPEYQRDVAFFEKEAIRRIKVGILASELMRKYKITVKPEKVRQMIEKIAMAYEDSKAVIQEYFADKERLKEVEAIVLEDELVEWLLTKAKITEKPMDFYSAVT